ncbi:MAG TPA: hypothetical protein VJ461_00860 [Candidatus Nanoarchaeia archaeon]|nr:hypothetical protein [Candidatus Nanoarchaeia archaeon]
MMAAKLHGFDDNMLCCESNAYTDVDCFKPEGIDEEAGSYQDTPTHLRGLKDFELEFLAQRNRKIHRC